jgi:energy-coupling factor transport system ATP-binding protein
VLTQFEELEGLSLEVPFAVRMSNELRKRGIPVDMHVDAGKLEAQLAQLLSPGVAR